MHWKFDVIDKFNKFKVELENQLGKNIKALRSDQDDEYKSSQFNSFLREHEILS